MDENEFWELIDAARRDVGWHRPRWQGLLDYDDYADRVAEAAAERLAAEPSDRMLAFDRVLRRLLDGPSYRWDLWAAAYLINGGCPRDGFDDFRGWIMAHGRDVWRRTLIDPDSLVDLVAADVEVEGEVSGGAMLTVAARAYALAGRDAETFRVAAGTGSPADRVEPVGERIDFSDPDAMRRRLPRLWVRFGWGDEAGGD